MVKCKTLGKSSRTKCDVKTSTESWTSFNLFQVLLRQEHHDEGSRQTVRIQVRLPCPHASLPNAEPRGCGRRGLRLQVSVRIRPLFLAWLSAMPQTQRTSVAIRRTHPGLARAPAIDLRRAAVGLLEPQLRHDNEQPVKPVRSEFFRFRTASATDDLRAKQPQIRWRRFIRWRIVSDHPDFGLVRVSAYFNVFLLRLDKSGKIFGTVSRLSHFTRSGFRLWDDGIRIFVEAPPASTPRALPLLVASRQSILKIWNFAEILVELVQKLSSR